MRTPNQIKGNKFEKWLELLLRYQGFKDVEKGFRRNKGYPYREADLKYTLEKNGRKRTVLVEAKYSSNGEIKYKLRTPKKKTEDGRVIVIDNLVDEVAERQRFLGGDISILVTNRTFEERVKEEAKRKGIVVIEGDRLTKIYYALGYTGSIEESIASIPD